MLWASHEETKDVVWKLVDTWFDYMEKIRHFEYISEDGKFGKDVDEDGHEEIWKCC